MEKIIWMITLLVLPGFLEVSAQVKKWTLADCINYAVDNNTGLQRQKLQTEAAQVNLTKSKLDYLPSLSVGSEVQLGFGRSIDPVTNAITFNQNISNYYYAGSDLDIFNGFTRLNNLSANKFMVRAGLENEKIVRNTLVGDILMQYYQIWYAKGVEDAAKMQLDLSEKQLYRVRKMVETGREASSRQYELESQVSTDRLAYTVAHNATAQAVTTMKHLLQLEPGSEFDILLPDLDQIPVTDTEFRSDSIYNIAAQILPRLKAIEFELAANEKQLKAAKGYNSPYITAQGQIYTGYYNVLNNGDLEQAPFREQIKNNNAQAVTLALRIPIFNRYVTARNIKLARLKKDDTYLKLTQEKNNMYTDIENACLNFNRGKDEFSSALANLEFNKKSFEAVEKKFEAGLIDVTDYSAAATKLYRADTENLRTKLQLMIRQILIEFYTTGEYEFILNK